MALRRLAILWTLLGVAGCAVTPLEDAVDATVERVGTRTSGVLLWPPDERLRQAAPPMEDPLTLPGALALAFTRNPDIRLQYARLGIAHADLQDAARISNPSLSLAWLSPDGAGRDQTTQGISASFADLLLLPARRRLSATDFRRLELAVGSALVDLAREVETAWYTEVGATQVAAMRVAVAEAAHQETELARRFHAAGNITRLQLDRQEVATARAQVDALQAQSDAAASRKRLANLLGLPEAGIWRTVDRLSVPPAMVLSAKDLAARAQTQRLDLASAREEVALLEDSLGVTERWRLLGSVDAGYERERETDGSELRGPTLELGLPIFNQGQAAVTRAKARLLEAQARADALTLEIDNEVTVGVRQLALAREVSERFLNDWLPAAASAVERQQERFNYMLVGAFELIQTKRDQYDAWQGYFEAVRDYWIARSALRSATGGLLPGDEEIMPPTAGPGDILNPSVDADKPAERREHHGDHQP